MWRSYKEKAQQQLCNTNPNQGEAEAMLLGIKEAKANQIRNIVVVGNSLNTLRAVQDSNYIPNRTLQPIIQDIGIALKDFHRLKLRKIYRNKNRCAYSIA